MFISLQIYHCMQLNAVLFVFDIMLTLLVTNTSSSSPVINKLHCLPAASVINSPWSVAAVYYIWHLNHSDVSWDRNFCSPYLHLMPPLGGPHGNIAMMFGTENLEWWGYPIMKKFWRYIYSFRQNPQMWQTDQRTHRQTLHDGIGCACIASRAKNREQLIVLVPICPGERAIKWILLIIIIINICLFCLYHHVC